MKTILLFLTLGTLLSFKTEGLINKTSPKSIVVLELFTSQGCSSCPPADALLNNVIKETEKNDKEIIALSLHGGLLHISGKCSILLNKQWKK